MSLRKLKWWDDFYQEYVGKEVSIMVNQSVLDSSVDLEQLKDIEELTPDMDRTI